MRCFVCGDAISDLARNPQMLRFLTRLVRFKAAEAITRRHDLNHFTDPAAQTKKTLDSQPSEGRAHLHRMELHLHTLTHTRRAGGWWFLSSHHNEENFQVLAVAVCRGEIRIRQRVTMATGDTDEDCTSDGELRGGIEYVHVPYIRPAYT